MLINVAEKNLYLIFMEWGRYMDNIQQKANAMQTGL